MIVVLDYGVGNLGSVCNMLRLSGSDICISSDPKLILSADKLVLPGVGHFDHGMKCLKSAGIRDTIDHFALVLQRPVLGICLGAQIMGNSSEEGVHPGLGWLDMSCKRFEHMSGIRVPHMGWNEIQLEKQSPLFPDQMDDSRYYFVHSYYMHCKEPNDILATSKHGIVFASGQAFG